VTTGRARLATAVVLAATVLQLLVASLVPGLPQFEGKGFTARLVLYPALMLLVPALWWLGHRGQPPPWTGFAVLMTPFLVDVTGNSLGLYDRVVWWDDANHLVNWFLLCLGLGLVVLPGVVAPTWVVAAVVTGGGAVLAVVWELGEWFTFIRHGTELATAYQDTLGDEALGTAGAAMAAAVLVRIRAVRGVGASG